MIATNSKLLPKYFVHNTLLWQLRKGHSPSTKHMLEAIFVFSFILNNLYTMVFPNLPEAGIEKKRKSERQESAPANCTLHGVPFLQVLLQYLHTWFLERLHCIKNLRLKTNTFQCTIKKHKKTENTVHKMHLTNIQNNSIPKITW